MRKPDGYSPLGLMHFTSKLIKPLNYDQIKPRIREAKLEENKDNYVHKSEARTIG